MDELPVPVEGYIDCVWPVDPGCLGDAWEEMTPDVRERALALASSTLRRLTGYRVGGCPTTVRPCGRACYTDWGAANGWAPLNWGGEWINTCSCPTACGCDSAKALALPPPVGMMGTVMVDGVEFTDYRKVGNSLWRTDGESWPLTQDLSLPDTEEGTYSIRYLNAYPVDNLGAWAAGILAVEFGKACAGGKCRLPTNVTSVVRQGVSFQIEGGAFPSGYVGIREVDAYIAIWNPNGLTQPPRVWTPTNQVAYE